MTPAYLNPPSSPYPLVEQREDQHLKLFISPYGASSSLSSCPTFFDMTQDERGSMLEESQDLQYEKVHRPISHGSCDHHAFSFSSSEAMEEDINNPHKWNICERGEGDRSKTATGPVQWMSSKMRLMQKMMEPNCSAANKPVRIVKKFQNNLQQGNLETTSPKISNNTIRVCADCNTTTTPLWRSGPRGPKSLCNACGIRQRKARRAMAEAAAAANGLVVANDISSTKSKVQNKEKKSRTSHFAQHKNKCKLTDSPQSERKLSFKDFAVSLRNNSDFGRVFPQDETEAAILLMELSCGLVHS